MASFLTPQELKAYPMPVSDSQWAKITDSQIQRVLDAATLAVQNWVDRRLVTGTYTQRIRGNGRSRLVLDEYPVTAVSAVSGLDNWNNSNTYAPSLLLINRDAGIIEWANSSYSAFWKGWVWTVSYTAGLPSIPEDVKHATALQAVDMLQPLFRGGVNFTGVELTTSTNEKIVDLLEPYKRKRMG